MGLAMTAGAVSSVIFAASNLPMLVKARRTRDLSSYSLPYLVLNNAGNLLYSLYVYQLPPGPIWAMQSFYLLSMGLLLRWYLRFAPRAAQSRAAFGRVRRGGSPGTATGHEFLSCGSGHRRRQNGLASRGMSNSRFWHRHPHDRR